MSVRDVRNAFTQVTADGRLDARDVDTVLRSTGGSISGDEERALKEEADRFQSVTDPGAGTRLAELLGELSPLRSQALRINRSVLAAAPRLSADAEARLTAGVATKSFGGSAIPEAVKTVVRDALASGATAYDVREMKEDPVYDTSHGEGALTLDGKFNPYAQNQRAVDSMAFSYTELTPEKIAWDMNTTQTFKVLSGYDRANGDQSARFETVTMKGSGRISALYDEATWSETKARAPGGQKYASNFAILADGSVHCVPASRRTAAEPWRILTTASLGRGQHMLFNGHLEMDKGVVTYVGMSGRLCKLQEKGEAKFVDPIALLKAWGFQLKPGLTVTQEG